MLPGSWRICWVVWLVIALVWSSPAQDDGEACTIGVASGMATSDGRPLLWKTRDNSDKPNNEVVFNTSYRYGFVEVVNAGGSYAWMGVNEKGFAIVNSYAGDLPAASSGMTNGLLMKVALGTCASVADFEHLLDSTNVTGRKTRANFGVIDSTGAAAIFETAGYVYWKFDATDSTQAPEGYIVRTNFALNGGGTSGIERYIRSNNLIHTFWSGDSLNYRSVLRYQMRDFSDSSSNPIPIPYHGYWAGGYPYGYIDASYSICRWSSVSAAVIQGVLPGESPRLSTMYTHLGQPAMGIFVPYWPVGTTPPVANGSPTAPLCDVANLIRSHVFDFYYDKHYLNSFKLRDDDGTGIWSQTFPAEDSILAVTDSVLALWRSQMPSSTEMRIVEYQLANYAYGKIQQVLGWISTITSPVSETAPGDFRIVGSYPNPFNAETVVEFTVPVRQRVELAVFNILGQCVATLLSGSVSPGTHRVRWKAGGFPSGVYLVRLKVPGTANTMPSRSMHITRVVLLK